MKFKKEVIVKAIGQLEEILEKMRRDEESSKVLLENIDPTYRKSAQNLIHYNAFRSFDVRDLQKQLKNMGLTRFANAEAHIMASVLTTRLLLGKLIGKEEDKSIKKIWSIKKGKSLQDKHTKNLLGYRSKGRRVRIMVTLPTAAAYDFEMVCKMVKEGMNCARINCAHDSPEIWEKIIVNVRKASKKMGRSVQVTMDLAGPKIRTGKLLPGPKVRKFKPKRDPSGIVVAPSEIILVAEIKGLSSWNALPISQEGLDSLEVNDVLFVVDARNKHRKLKIVSVSETHAVAHCTQTIYMETGALLSKVKGQITEIKVGELPSVEQPIVLKKGDILDISKTELLGHNMVLGDDGKVLAPARVSCQVPQVFEHVMIGEKVLFDDGKIEGTIKAVEKNLLKVLITMAKEGGSALKAYKGINFPDSTLKFSGLTDKDRSDLQFIAEHADIVNFSFVNSALDVRELHMELRKLGALDKLDVILKIETKLAVNNLVEILLEAMKIEGVGVMIARGDLAIETGWENIGKVQQDMLSICGAAHIPVIWATQVLENLAKKGLPSRSEITDATAALKAECVMLNKGPYVYEAIRLLNTILSKMEPSQNKKESMLPILGTLVA